MCEHDESKCIEKKVQKRRTMMVWGGNIFGGTISDNLAQEWLKGDGEE